MKTHNKLLGLAIGCLMASASSVNAASTADVITIIDESGSMGGEQAWISGMINSLDADLNTAGVTSNQYGLVGFGGGSSHQPGHSHLVGGGEFGTAAQFGAAAGSLITSGGFEDGYDAIDTANGYSFRSGAARNYILVTDEDRDNGNNSLNYNNMLSSMTATNTLLNAVVNASFTCDGGAALGIDSKGTGYMADGAGGFTTCGNGLALSGSGSTIADYVNLALATGGAAWNLNLLRAGGLLADSFTDAFVSIKVGEIITQPGPTIPEPATLALMGLGFLGLSAVSRKARV